MRLSGMRRGSILVLLLSMVVLVHSSRGATTPSKFSKEGMPNFGQHSGSWCWVGSTASQLWWSAQNGVPDLVPSSFQEISVDSKNPSSPYYDVNFPDKGYPELFEQIAQATFHDDNRNGVQDPGESSYVYGTATLSQGVWPWDYLVGLSHYITARGVDVTVNYLSQRLTDTSGCAGTVAGAATSGTTLPHVHITYAAPTFQDYMAELYSTGGIVLSINIDGGGGHDVTAVGYDNTVSPATITISDPGHPCIDVEGGACASSNNNPSTADYSTCTITNTSPFRGSCQGGPPSYTFTVSALTSFSLPPNKVITDPGVASIIGAVVAIVLIGAVVLLGFLLVKRRRVAGMPPGIAGSAGVPGTYCPHCGTPFLPNGTFCGRCGTARPTRTP